MSKTLDIVSLIKINPLIALHNSKYDTAIVNKIKERFKTADERLFVANFYCYLNYNERKDFIIDLEHIWKWLGFARKEYCKKLLIKNFTENEDYVVQKSSEEEKIILTIRSFKKLCFITKTKKSKEIYEYYLNLQEVLFEVIKEQERILVQRLKD
jgi:hypothetical protein